MLRPDEYKAVSVAMYALGEVFNRSISDKLIDLYIAGLAGVKTRDILNACQAAIQSSRFFPSPAELRDLAGAKSPARPEHRALLAWNAVRQAIQKVGAYVSPDFEDPTIHAVVRQLGGWTTICECQTDEMQWLEKRFLAAYDSMRRMDLPPDQARRLVGLVELDNAGGSQSPTAIPITAIRCLSVEEPQAIAYVDKTEPLAITSNQNSTRQPIAMIAKAVTFSEIPAATQERPVLDDEQAATRRKQDQLHRLRIKFPSAKEPKHGIQPTVTQTDRPEPLSQP